MYNNFTLSTKNCQIITFSRVRAFSNFDYNLNGVVIHRIMGPVENLGIFFDPKLKFECHINDIVNRSNKILGFIRRNCADFDDTLALKSIY